MTSLNTLTLDTEHDKNNPEVLIELPDPKIISNDCTIIMNGHHNYGMAEEKETVVNGDEDEDEPLFNHNSSHLKNSSSNLFPLNKSSTASSLDEDSDPDLEPESSTHLLQDQKQNEQSPISLKSKTKLPSFRSPSKKETVTDAHSHIQHKPLGPPQSTLPNPICHVAKKYWHCTPIIWLLLCVMTVVVSLCLTIGLYLATVTKCEPPRQWWQRATFYEVFPASFQDSDADGFGDLKGLTQRLDYIQNLSVDAVRLNSIFSALDYPLEYEHVIDFSNIDPHIGRIEDFQEFVRQVHSRNMHLILDVNPTITSDQHTWAAHWLLHRQGPFEYFYFNITENVDDEPPMEDNPDYAEMIWSSSHRTFGDHLYLNWSNPSLQQEMSKILELWLSQGIDGFYFKHIEDMHVEDRSHIVQILHQWRQILDHHSLNNSRKVLMISHEDMEYLELVVDPMSFTSVPSIIDLVDASISLKKPNSSELYVAEEVNRLRSFWNQFPFPPTIVWHMGAVETMRLASRFGAEMNMAGLVLLTILPGSFSLFYGDEIGMKDSFDQTNQKVYRGGQLGPMPWTSDSQGNFTRSDIKGWFPMHPESIVVNVESQVEKLQLFRKLTSLKKSSHTLLPTIIRPTLQEVFFLFNTPQEQEPPEYRFYQNRCGLLVVEILHNEGVLFANFGWEIQRLASNECGEHDDLMSFITFDSIEPILSTNTSLKGQIKWRDLVLKPGDAIIGAMLN